MHSIERIGRRIGNGIGLLALAASFALASPGVTVVRAETLTSEAPPAAQCAAAAESEQGKDAAIAGFIDQLRAEHAAAAATGGDESGVVVLNNRGYNYGPAQTIELDAILAEARAAR